MKFLATCTVLVSLCATYPALSQSADSTAGATASGEALPVDLSGFREEIANKNKSLTDKVNAEKAIVKKNAVIIENAKRIDAANKKLEAQRKQLDAQNAVFEQERRAMLPDQPQQQQPEAVAPQQTIAPSNNNARPTSAPARVEPPVAPVRMELAGATVIPAGAATAPPPSPSLTPVSAPISAPAPAPAPAPVQMQPQSSVTVPAQPSTATATVVVSAAPMRVPEGVSMGMLLTPIRPVYPQIAQSAHVEGSVVLDAVISKAGAIESLHAVSGPEMLRRAAMDAVQTAHYQPYRVNGETVQVATTITVVFRMRS